MAISTPTTTDTPPPITPRTETLTTVAAQAAALDELIGLAQRAIRVFDVDLSGMGWNSPGRIEALSAFLRRSRLARLDVVVHSTRHVESACPRLLMLQRRFGDAVAIHRTGEQARAAMDPLVLVDGVHFLHRFHADQPRAALGIEQPQAAKPLCERFDEIWADSEPGVTGTTLGL
jgi:hypothetical protein